MMRALAVACCAVLAAGCQSVQPYYEASNYRTLDWATLSFDQAKATCRYETLHHNRVMDVYELEIPRYRACMEKNGYAFGMDAAGVAPTRPNADPHAPLQAQMRQQERALEAQYR